MNSPERHIQFGIKRVDEKEAALLNASDIIAEQCQHPAAIGLDGDKSRCNECKCDNQNGNTRREITIDQEKDAYCY